MNQRSQKSIEECLRQGHIQKRIWSTIQEARENVTVTISRAASLFDVSESRLREWEKRGLLKTKRPVLSQQGKGSTGHRQYSSMELDKLAIIHVLLEEGYTPGEIPPDVDQLWGTIVGAENRSAPVQQNISLDAGGEHQSHQHLPIDKRVEEVDRQEFWRYFVSQALRISLLLICEDAPDMLAGIILPLEERELAKEIQVPEELPRVGLSLVGWLRNGTFYAFLHEAPTFEFPSDFRLERLTVPSQNLTTEEGVLETMLIVLQRKARVLVLVPELIETVRRVLDLVYRCRASWKSAFGYRMYDWLYYTHSLEGASAVADDLIFHLLLEQVIELGGKKSDGQDRWSFCTFLLPDNASLPIQQQTLIVRGQTRKSPYENGITLVDQAQTDSLSLKAFQSGHIIYFAETLVGQSMAIYQPPAVVTRRSANAIPPSEELPEKDTRSAIALPIIGEYGISAAVLYIASEEAQAFSKDDQRALRVIGKMMEEMLLSSQARSRSFGKLGDIISNPAVVDTAFRNFASETDFMSETEALLTGIQRKILAGESLDGQLSIISIDLDSQSGVAIKYGNRVARNLSQLMGNRINKQIKTSSKYAWSKLFHISADKYYWLLPDLSLEEAQELARRLKEALQLDYRLDPTMTASSHMVLPENGLGLAGITVHLGIAFYTFSKLEELLRRYPEAVAVQNVRAVIATGIEISLERGKSLGGNCIVSWLPHAWGWGYGLLAD